MKWTWIVPDVLVIGLGVTLPVPISRCAGEVRSAIWITPVPLGQPVGRGRGGDDRRRARALRVVAVGVRSDDDDDQRAPTSACCTV